MKASRTFGAKRSPLECRQLGDKRTRSTQSKVLRILTHTRHRMPAPSLDHLGRSCEEYARDSDPHGFRSLQIDDKLEFARLLDG